MKEPKRMTGPTEKKKKYIIRRQQTKSHFVNCWRKKKEYDSLEERYLEGCRQGFLYIAEKGERVREVSVSP